MTVAILDTITVLSVIILVLVFPFIKKVTNNYFFWLVLGVGLLTYLIVARFADGWKNFTTYGNDGNIITSKAFLLDICPFVAFAICVSVVVDPTRKLAKVIAPFCLFGGLLTILGGINQDEGLELSWRYIFLGIAPNQMYFMMHYINVVMGLLVLLSIPKMNWADWIYCNIFALCYYSYVAIVMTVYNVDINVSGLNAKDWDPNWGGEYSGVTNVIHLSFPLIAILGLIVSYSFITGIIFLQPQLQRIKKYRIYNVWTKENWYKGWYQLEKTHHPEPDNFIVMVFKRMRKKHKAKPLK